LSKELWTIKSTRTNVSPTSGGENERSTLQENAQTTGELKRVEINEATVETGGFKNAQKKNRRNRAFPSIRWRTTNQMHKKTGGGSKREEKRIGKVTKKPGQWKRQKGGEGPFSIRHRKPGGKITVNKTKKGKVRIFHSIEPSFVSKKSMTTRKPAKGGESKHLQPRAFWEREKQEGETKVGGKDQEVKTGKGKGEGVRKKKKHR